jgi:cytoskeletal protein CcmA (bactofilin family)
MVQGAGNAPVNEVTIDGPHRGNIRAGSVKISRSGSVVGNIVARVVHVSGRIEGDVDAKEFYAAPQARIRGTIRQEIVGLMPGCTFSGTLERVPFTAFEVPVQQEAAAPVAAPAAQVVEAAPSDLPFRSGPAGIVWVPPSSEAQKPSLTEERRNRMMENVKAALADVAAGLSTIAPEAGDPATPAGEPVQVKRVLPSLLG